jgi:hypothetical protein
VYFKRWLPEVPISDNVSFRFTDNKAVLIERLCFAHALTVTTNVRTLLYCIALYCEEQFFSLTLLMEHIMLADDFHKQNARSDYRASMYLPSHYRSVFFAQST